MYRRAKRPKPTKESGSKARKRRRSPRPPPRPSISAPPPAAKPAKRATKRRAPRVAVVGVGNPLMCDDGAGIEVLEALRKLTLPAGVDILDCGTGGMALLHTLADLDGAVIVDAVNFGGAPGEVKTFSPDDAVSVKELRRLTLHEGDVFEILVLARKLGQCPERIVICAIQPKRIEPIHGMTREVEARIPELAAHARRALKSLFERGR